MEHVNPWIMWANIFIFVFSLVVLGLAIANLVRTVKINRTTRWTILRSQVYNNKALESQKELEQAANALLENLKRQNNSE